MTRRRAFWPGQSGQSVPPGFLGDGDGERPPAPAVRWRAIDHPLYPDDVEHGPLPSAADESYALGESYSSDTPHDSYDAYDSYDSNEPDQPDGFARYDRYGRFDDHYLVDADDLDDAGRHGPGRPGGDGHETGRHGADDHEPAGYRGHGNGRGGPGSDRREPDGRDAGRYGDDGYETGWYGSDGYEADGYGSDGYGADGYGRDLPGAGGGEGERRPVGLYRFDDLAHPDDPGGADPTEPLGDVLRDAGVRNDAGSVLRAMLVDRDDYRVEPRRRRGQRGRWRLALAERMVAAWPGQSEEGAPPGFPASGELVLHPPPVGATLVRLPVRGEAADDLDSLDLDPMDGEAAADDPVEGTAAAADVRIEGTPTVARGRFGGSRPVAGGRSDPTRSPSPGSPSPRSLQKVALAVYAALADPIVNADPEARERRTAQARRLGLLAGSAALAVVLIYGIFPVRTYLEQRAATQRARERIDKLSEANAELEQRKEELRDDETVEEIARRDYGLVFPGEESYGLLPPPVPPTTTTTTPPDG